MNTFNERKLLGFLDLDLGALEVRVPVRSVEPADARPSSAPVAVLECDGSTCEIVVRSDANTSAVTECLHDLAEQALRHLSQKLLN